MIQQEHKTLILPGDPEFEETLMTPPPNWHDTAIQDGTSYAFVAEPGSGLMRVVNMVELEEYIEGGEYNERLLEIYDDDELEELQDII